MAPVAALEEYDSDSSSSSESEEGYWEDAEDDEFNRVPAHERAVAECPIRTKYNPNRRKHKHHHGSRRRSTSGALAVKTAGSVATMGHTASQKAVKGLRNEARAIKATAKHLVTDVTANLTGAGADRVQFEFVEILNRQTAPDSLESLGIQGAALTNELRKRSLAQVKESCGLGKKSSEFNRMDDNGKYHCGAKEARIQAGLQTKFKPKEFAAHMSRAEVMALMRGGKEDIARHGAFAKTDIDPEALEDMWRANQGGNAIRRKPEDHEMVFDFGDHRISVERHLADERAGQMLSIEPHLNAKGTRGEVTIHVQVPKRQAIKGAVDLEALCDVEQLEELSKILDHGEECGEIKNQSHLRLTRGPPSWKAWKEWRRIQEQKRAEMRAAAAKSAWKRVDEEKDAKKGQEEEDAESDLESVVEISVTGSSPRKGVSPRGGASARSPRGGGRPVDGRRGGIDLSALAAVEDVPWDCRPPPNPADLRRLLKAAELESKARALVKKPKRRRSRKSTNGQAEMTDSQFMSSAVEEEDVMWTLRAAGAGSFEFTFAVAQDFDEAEAPELGGDDDDDFWKDVFSPAPPKQSVPKCLAVCGW